MEDCSFDVTGVRLTVVCVCRFRTTISKSTLFPSLLRFEEYCNLVPSGDSSPLCSFIPHGGNVICSSPVPSGFIQKIAVVFFPSHWKSLLKTIFSTNSALAKFAAPNTIAATSIEIVFLIMILFSPSASAARAVFVNPLAPPAAGSCTGESLRSARTSGAASRAKHDDGAHCPCRPSFGIEIDSQPCVIVRMPLVNGGAYPAERYGLGTNPAGNTGQARKFRQSLESGTPHLSRYRTRR